MNAPADAIVVNSCLGGDSCHRGAVLGCILGAIHGVSEQVLIPQWKQDLYDREATMQLCKSFAKHLTME